MTIETRRAHERGLGVAFTAVSSKAIRSGNDKLADVNPSSA
jgi:hypothetical protein